MDPAVVKFIELLAPGADLEADVETIWVSPEAPTIAQDVERYPLLGTDILRLHFVSMFQSALLKSGLNSAFSNLAGPNNAFGARDHQCGQVSHSIGPNTCPLSYIRWSVTN